MPNGHNNPDIRDLWNVVNEVREDVAEMKGMLKVHMSDPSIHHTPPCGPLRDLQKVVFAAAGSAVLALLAAVGSLSLAWLTRR